MEFDSGKKDNHFTSILSIPPPIDAPSVDIPNKQYFSFRPSKKYIQPQRSQPEFKNVAINSYNRHLDYHTLNKTPIKRDEYKKNMEIIKKGFKDMHDAELSKNIPDENVRNKIYEISARKFYEILSSTMQACKWRTRSGYHQHPEIPQEVTSNPLLSRIFVNMDKSFYFNKFEQKEISPGVPANVWEPKTDEIKSINEAFQTDDQSEMGVRYHKAKERADERKRITMVELGLDSSIKTQDQYANSNIPQKTNTGKKSKLVNEFYGWNRMKNDIQKKFKIEISDLIYALKQNDDNLLKQIACKYYFLRK